MPGFKGQRDRRSTVCLTGNLPPVIVAGPGGIECATVDVPPRTGEDPA